ncbi:TetM/TetW/TetO/TetS family tetracycline resistance ribosomal protection protein [Heyndrickxia oleronia]|uniref:elongation factor G n=1 Tax=Heyndrickxia oleronia TaxID=38875 RepID=UPI00203C9211|nr:TetM/TetW/TetO/TetS family tetracycline resistance ribosomal protection protein [Heyndrickxia oleronia]MCM3240153.1 TetM/TetW/TetO/TetS family tetracycline resistance ribosomal protection protein [Heyndrickxia oleronia]
MKIINIGIVAHVDAGKTSLTERILFETAVIDTIGKVDHGNTQTDSMELERRRGITIKASVVSFFLKDIKINLIDTPGHADFIAEVERSLSVLDGAILVISAVEGIQAQTKILMSILKKLRIPTLIFINKIDRMGAKSTRLIENVKEKLIENIIPLYTVENLGTKEAEIVQKQFNAESDPYFFEESLLALNDDSLLEAYVNERKITEEQIKPIMINQIKECKLCPVYFGSAMTGIGVRELLNGVETMLPVSHGLEKESLSGIVFKIEREASGEKIAYIRVFSGIIHVREYVKINRKSIEKTINTHTEKIKKIHQFYNGSSVISPKVTAGDFCKVWGLKDIKIGDLVGEWSDKIMNIPFVAPQLETQIKPVQKEKTHDLYQALMEMSEEDPLIHVLKDDFHHDLFIRIFGEVQKEVIHSVLKEKYHVDVTFTETRVICIEKPKGIGQALERMGEANNPFYGTVGFRVEPGEFGSGKTYKLGVELGSLPLAFHKAIEETVFDVLKQGLSGWEVEDIVVTLTHTGYASPVTTASDFRKLVPLVLMEALVKAGTDVYEPMNKFELSVPANFISQAMFKLSAIQAEFTEPFFRRDSYILKGTLPMAVTENFKRNLYSFTEGEGIFIAKPYGYKKMVSDSPVRKRVDFNPLNRKDYLLHVMKAY